MAEIPYVVALQSVLTALGRGTVSYQVPTNEQLRVKDLIHSATGIFNVIGIRSSGSLYHTNASEDVPIKSTHLKAVGSNNNSINPFWEEMIVNAGDTLYIDLKDTSNAGNTVNISLACIRKIG